MKQAQKKMISTLGPLYLVASDKGLKGVYWEDPKMDSSPDKCHMKILKQAEKEIREYLNGRRKSFGVTLDIEGTDFQKRVWKEVLKISYGTTKSYKELALLLEDEKAARAVGSANGKNPLMIIIPCHRVLSSNGLLGGYAGGIARKRKLLSLEDITSDFTLRS